MWVQEGVFCGCPELLWGRDAVSVPANRDYRNGCVCLEERISKNKSINVWRF